MSEMPEMNGVEPDEDQMEDHQQAVDMMQNLEKLAQEEAKIRSLYDPETQNIADKLDEEILNKIGAEVYKLFKEDDDSRLEWDDMHAEWIKLFYGTDEPLYQQEIRRWGNASSMPILTEAAIQFQSRTYKSFFSQRTFVSAIPIGRGDDQEERAKRIGRHMSYQLGVKDRKYKSTKSKLFMAVAIHGSMFTKTFYDPDKRRVVVENVRPIDLVVPYHIGPVDLDELDRKTNVIRMSELKAKRYKDMGFFIDMPAPDYNVELNQVDMAVNDATGLHDTSNKTGNNYTILEQHTFLDLEDNGEYKPYIVWVCKNSKKVLRISIRYETDEVGNPTNNYEPIEYFTHYQFITNPNGFYGLGLGILVGDMNSTVNTILRQAIDAATLANDGNNSGFFSERLGVRGQELAMSLGKFTKVPDTTGDLQAGIFQFQFPGPNSALIQLGQYLDQRAQRLGSTTEALTGSPESARQPTTILTEVEQGLEVFTTVQQQLADSLNHELAKIYRLNGKFLPLVDYFVVNGATEEITRDDYQDDMQVEAVFDPRFSTQAQKIARAQAELDATMRNPNNQQRPEVIDAAFKRYLEIIEVDDIDELIPEPPEPQKIDDQHEENMYFMLPPNKRPMFDVFPDQNHLKHVAVIDEFLNSYGQMLDQETLMLIDQHRKEHVAYQYGVEFKVIPENQEVSNDTGRNTGLAAAIGNAMVSGGGSVKTQMPAGLDAMQIFGGAPLQSGGAGGSENNEGRSE